MIDEKARVEAKGANMELGTIPILLSQERPNQNVPHMLGFIQTPDVFYEIKGKLFVYIFRFI
jgi:hypothetical protein